jgi:hypothetical protein
MTTWLRISLLTLFLAFGLLNESKAQEKYEYATVTYQPPFGANKGLFVSISGKEFEEIAVKKDQVKHGIYDYTILLNYVQGMTESGWKVINTVSAVPGSQIASITFILERKTPN